MVRVRRLGGLVAACVLVGGLGVAVAQDTPAPPVPAPAAPAEGTSTTDGAATPVEAAQLGLAALKDKDKDQLRNLTLPKEREKFDRQIGLVLKSLNVESFEVEGATDEEQPKGSRTANVKFSWKAMLDEKVFGDLAVEMAKADAINNGLSPDQAEQMIRPLIMSTLPAMKAHMEKPNHRMQVVQGESGRWFMQKVVEAPGRGGPAPKGPHGAPAGPGAGK